MLGQTSRIRQRNQVNYLTGMSAEDAIAADYVKRGYRLAHKRWRGKRGELDLIFEQDAGFIIVEVKQGKSFQAAMARMTPQKMGHIHAATEEFLATCAAGAFTELRFDVALVDQTGRFEILENAQ